MTKKIILMFIISLIATALCGCTSNDEKELSMTYINISYEEARQMMENNPSIIVLDVRTEQEHRERNMHGSLLLPLNELTIENALRVIPDKDSVVIVYCRSGARSSNAATALINMGYINVYKMDGVIHWN